MLTPEAQTLVRTLVKNSQHLWTIPKSFYIQIGIEKYYEKIQSILTQGYIFTVDYGSDGWHYLNQPVQKKMLRTFSKEHGNDKNFLECPGELDITCDVNFSNLASVGQQRGCNVTYFGVQDSLGGPNLSEFRVLIQNIGITDPECGKKLCENMRESSPVYFEELASLRGLLAEGEKLFTALKTEKHRIKEPLENFLNWLEVNRYRHRDRAFMSNLNEEFSNILIIFLVNVKHKAILVEIAGKNIVHAEILLTALMYIAQRMFNDKDPKDLALFLRVAGIAQEFVLTMFRKYPKMTTKVMNTVNLADYNLHQDSSENSILNRCLAAANKKLVKLNDLAEKMKEKGNQHFAKEEYTAAIACYEHALLYRPVFKEAFLNAGICHKKLNQNEPALACFRKAVVIDSNYEKAVKNLKALESEMISNERAPNPPL